MSDGAVVVVGGTRGMGNALARHYLNAGKDVYITGRDLDRATEVAAELGDRATGIGFDLAKPDTIGPALADVRSVSRLALVAIDRDVNPVREFDIESATNTILMKMVGYVETIHALLPSLSDDSSVVLFGGLAKERPYPGSTTITTVNGGVTSLIRTLAVELAPIRFNAIHPGIVGDTEYWESKPLDGFISRTPTGKLATTADVVDATVFLLENQSVNGVNLFVDGGWMLM